MKKWLVGLAIVVVGLGVGVGVVWWQNTRQSESFSLSADNYGEAATPEITAVEFEKLATEEQSFIVVVHMMLCPAELPLKDVAKRLAQGEKLRIYFLNEHEFEQTKLKDEMKYLPTAVVIRDGEVVEFLDAEADEDVEAYQTVEGLKDWLEKAGVELRKY